jgi:SAM-dependent methyltransferase
MSELVDAEALAASADTAELAARADELVRSMGDPWALLAKPAASLREAPELMSTFGMLLGALAPLPGMTVLDFAAGSCWTSWLMAQLGCKVVASDISVAMLELGRRRFAQQPLFGPQPEPTFLPFDGEHLDLDDQSVDRVLCFDALHHVADFGVVLAEMARVLRPGGRAGFAEPGPRHSVDPQSQHEMRRYKVPERDIVLEDLWVTARDAGFAELRVAIVDPAPQWVSLARFSSFLEVKGPLGRLAGAAERRLLGGRRADGGLRRRLGRLAGAAAAASLPVVLDHAAHVRRGLANRRMFLLFKEGEEQLDSRQVAGLGASLELAGVQVERAGDRCRVRAVAQVTNTGASQWIPSGSAELGAVRLGLRVRRGGRPAADHGRVPLPSEGPIRPGTSLRVPFETEVLLGPHDRDAVLEVDLVAEGITWFASVQEAPKEIELSPERPRLRG